MGSPIIKSNQTQHYSAIYRKRISGADVVNGRLICGRKTGP